MAGHSGDSRRLILTVALSLLVLPHDALCFVSTLSASPRLARAATRATPALRAAFASGLMPNTGSRRARLAGRAMQTGLQMQDGGMMLPKDSPQDILNWTKKQDRERKEEKGRKASVQTKPYGEWDSPISSKDLTDGAVGLGAPVFDGDALYWLEGRPSEQGRVVVVKKDASGITDVTPANFNVRTRVHEYGGGDFTVSAGIVYFTNFKDQRLYAQLAFPGAEPIPLTPEGKLRFADFAMDVARDRLVCVVEDHSVEGQEPSNSLAAISLEGPSEDGVFPPIVTLASGRDFYAAPRLRKDGGALAYVSWMHPNMPWDSTSLFVSDVQDDGSVTDAREVAGGPQESVTSPVWDALGDLYFVSDRSGFYNIYRLDENKGVNLKEMEAEFAGPMWRLGGQAFSFLPDGRILCNVKQPGVVGSKLSILDPLDGGLTPVGAGYSQFGGFAVSEQGVAILGGSFKKPMELALVPTDKLEGGKADVVKVSTEYQVRSLFLSQPEMIEFPTGREGESAWMVYYPPQNAKFTPPDGTLPPLLVKSHGGPTASTSTSFNLGIQFWTSRGYAVADVDYSGSSGYGRAYRQRLQGQWGVKDVEDCCAAAQYLEKQQLVDGLKMAIDGGSAGGYTTLSALAFKDVFKAGCSMYGIGDLDALARDTHKFESRYLDSLIGPLPEAASVYKERSPINSIDKFDCPIIFFQGADDKVVPLNQAEMMHKAVKDKGVLTSLVVFEGEAHGFRKAENIQRSIEGELFFFNTAFGLNAKMPDTMEDIVMDNYDPMLPNEVRSFIMVDGWQMEIGEESGVIRLLGKEPIAEEAFFPEVRPDRPTGGSSDRDREETLDDFVEWL
mmetsp:Transcript_66776/g.108320  ORF Transcript_66776/g.108320 Transcript_66776/m.108320 type:complete len:841 (+) Transcript_66776:271-2793(+)